MWRAPGRASTLSGVSTAIRPRTAAEVGGKAAVLLELERAGFRVPPLAVSPPDLRAAVERLGFPLAVRSSATVEDGARASFAGQFESILRLESLEAVEAAVTRVRASARSPSVVEYCQKAGIDPARVRMEVIVQRMVRPALAGVAFSVNPVTGAEEVVVEAVAGLADDLLHGSAQPLPPGDALLARHRPAIVEVVRRLQRHFGAPQDVEFAVTDDGQVWVLQSRPITRIAFAADVGEWTNADFRDGGVSAGPCTPLMWSLYDHVWSHALPDYLRELRLLPEGEGFVAGRMFFGRPYWNLGAVKRCLARLPGFVEREFDLDLSVEPRYEGPGLVTPVTLLGLLRALPTARAIGRVFDAQEAFDRDFLAADHPRGFEALLREHERVPDGSAVEVAQALRRVVEGPFRTTELNYFRTIFCASIAKLDFKDAFPWADATALCAGLPPMRHLAPTLALRDMAARGDADLGPLIARFRHHSRRELDLRAPRWDEDRPFVEALLAQYRASRPQGEDPRPAYERARAAQRARAPFWRRRAFDRKLDRLRAFVWLREEMRDCSSRMYWLIRRHVLALAARRGLGDDAFFMTWRQLVDDDRSGVAAARETYEAYREFKAPNELGARFAFSSAPRAAAGDLRGIGASPGRARGVARVARTPDDALRVEAGAILVCPFTDPGWTPVLDRVAAVVTETGGLLSHAAVICREYGIPAVLGVPGATERIPDGRLVVVDGGEGRVELVA